MCLACATPVRGRALGAECLATALGPDVPAPRLVERAPGAVAMTVARAGFGLAVVASILPWSRFGAGAQPFGAWASWPRWSALAALASVAGFLLSFARRPSPAGTRRWDVASAAAGGLVVAGSLLALARPPAFTSSWLGPWVALGAGVVAAAASAVALRGDRAREPARV
jgi:hypothetical protein